MVSWTRLARVQQPRMYAVSVGLECAMLDESSIKSSTLTSVCVALGGSESRTVRKVSVCDLDQCTDSKQFEHQYLQRTLGHSNSMYQIECLETTKSKST